MAKDCRLPFDNGPLLEGTSLVRISADMGRFWSCGGKLINILAEGDMSREAPIVDWGRMMAEGVILEEEELSPVPSATESKLEPVALSSRRDFLNADSFLRVCISF
mmetsp:Transcript_3774/g.14325  ORF Transcript_3774/g.14325 Transcript_3774/m.14325 type:complete len:106 (-) Transcript_3774:1154-1471(-)